MRVLITGITGPVGSFLADHLLTIPGLELHAFKRWRSDPRPIAHLLGHVAIHEGDIEDAFAVAQYGTVRPDEVPIREDRPMRPGSPYGVSKVAAELTGLQYHDNFGMHVLVTRSFNHVGPRQGDRCSIQTFCRQMAAIELGLQEPLLHVGNLEPRRDFTHTRDVARALWLLIERGAPGEVYNLCSGRATRIGDIVAMVLERGRVPAEVRTDPARLRPSDEPVLQGDNRKLRAATGWEPTVSIEQIVDELLEYWRARLAKEG